LNPAHIFWLENNRVSFQKIDNPKRRKHVLDLVHLDICSMFEKSLGGAYYFISFIDEHSRRVWIYLLNTKDQVIQAFKEYHVMVERETGKKLKCAQANNGGEYHDPFEAYCKTYGIELENMPPKTPQLNGVVKRMN